MQDQMLSGRYRDKFEVNPITLPVFNSVPLVHTVPNFQAASEPVE